MSVLRPLPPRPSLEFERKEAKALLRRLHSGDPDAVARAGDGLGNALPSEPHRFRLADAQLVIAREYGFASWPRLVGYFQDVHRQSHRRRQWLQSEHYESLARSLIAGHQARSGMAGRMFAAYVPRFYGMSLVEVYDATVTEDDARLAIARSDGFPSWQVLLERIPEAQQDEWAADPRRDAGDAVRAADLARLKRVVATHPGVLHASAYDSDVGRRLLSTVLAAERRQGIETMRPIVDWLATQGLDVQHELNLQLCGQSMRNDAEKVRWLLDRGADPNWVAPNGIPVLEHALIRYWDGAAVDALAARAKPRRALWIAAGLGDVVGVARFLDANGKPTRAARRLRPDFTAVGPLELPRNPAPDDEDVLMEAFIVATFNGRTEVLEYMVSRGLDVNSLVWDEPILNMAVGNGWVLVVECLLRCGADPDLRSRRPGQSARELARELFEQTAPHADYRRVAELCGLDPDTILADRDERPTAAPVEHPWLKEAYDLAGDDAFRLKQPTIRTENLLVGLLRRFGPSILFPAASSIDRDRFRADMADRLVVSEDRVERPELPLDADAKAAIERATVIAAERRHTIVTVIHLLVALTESGEGSVADLLARYGSSVAGVNAKLDDQL